MQERHFEDLTNSEQQLVLERINSINYSRATDILEFSSKKSKDIAGLTDEIFNIQTRNPIYSLSDPIFGVITAIRHQNPKDILGTVTTSSTEKDFGIFRSIQEMLSMRKIHKSMAQAIYSLNALMKNIKGMQVDLVKQQFVLQKDISAYQKMVENATNLLNELELDSIALEEIQEKVQSEIEQLTNNGNREVGIVETNKIDDLNSTIRLIISRLESIRTSRVMTFQSIMQLDMLISTNKKLCTKIDEINDVVLPLWKRQYTSAIEIINQKHAISLQKVIRGIATKVLTGNSQYLRDTISSAQNEISTTATAIDDLATTQTYIDDTLTSVAQTVCPVLGSPVSK